MTTLLIISAAAFALSALAWFSTWAIWIHPPEGWLGKEVVNVAPISENDAVRHSLWYKGLKVVTVLLGLTTLALLGALIRDHRLTM